METICIATNKGVEFYKISNIIRIQGMSNYCKIYFADKHYPLTVAKVLHWFEEHLPVEVFWRTHKTHIVNNNYVEKIHASDKPYLVLSNGETIAVSRRRAPLFKITVHAAIN